MSLIVAEMEDFNLKKDKKIAFAAYYYFLASAINSTIKVVFPSASSYGSTISAITGASILFFFLLGFPTVWRRSKIILIKSYLVFGALYFISIVLSTFRGDPIDLIISGSAFLTFAWWIPVGVYVCSVYNSTVLYNTFLKGSYYLSAVLLLMFIFHPSTIYGETGYNMYFGTAIIIPTLFHLNELTKKRRMIVFLFFIVEIVTILIYANRGVLASVLFFVFYRYFIDNRDKKKKLIALSLIILFTLLFIVFQKQILTYLLGGLESLGIQSRTLSMMLGSSFLSDSSNRETIWEQSLRMIEQKPLLGWGLGGEYYELARRTEDAWIVDSSFNSHNALLQNFVNFGILGGFIANILFILPLFNLLKIKDQKQNDLILISGSAIVPCFISAAGLFVKPIAAIFFYLYYYKKNNKE